MAETRAKKVRSRQITTLIVGLFACLFVLPLVWMILTSLNQQMKFSAQRTGCLVSGTGQTMLRFGRTLSFPWQSVIGTLS